MPLLYYSSSWLLTQQVVQEPLLTLTSTHKTLASDGLSTPLHPWPPPPKTSLFLGHTRKKKDDSGCESIGESCPCCTRVVATSSEKDSKPESPWQGFLHLLLCAYHTSTSRTRPGPHRPTAPTFASAQSKSSLSACSFLLKLGGASQTQTPKNSWPKETWDFQQDSLHGAPNNTTHLFTPAPCLLHCFRHLLSNPIPSAGKTSNFSNSNISNQHQQNLSLPPYSVPTDVVYKRFR